MERFVFRNRMPLRFLVWIMMGGVLSYLLANHYAFKLTSLNRTVPGLSPNTLYLVARGSDFCQSDIVLFRSFSKRKTFIRPVSAVGESTFALTPAGYRIDTVEHTMPEAWQEATRARLAATGERALAPNEVLIVNDDFGRPFASDKNDWPYEIVTFDAIRAKVTTVLFAERFGDIGQAVGSGKSCDRRTLGGHPIVPLSAAIRAQQSSRPHVPDIPFWSFKLKRQKNYNSDQKDLIAHMRPSVD